MVFLWPHYKLSHHYTPDRTWRSSNSNCVSVPKSTIFSTNFNNFFYCRDIWDSTCSTCTYHFLLGDLSCSSLRLKSPRLNSPFIGLASPGRSATVDLVSAVLVITLFLFNASLFNKEFCSSSCETGTASPERPSSITSHVQSIPVSCIKPFWIGMLFWSRPSTEELTFNCPGVPGEPCACSPTVVAMVTGAVSELNKSLREVTVIGDPFENEFGSDNWIPLESVFVKLFLTAAPTEFCDNKNAPGVGGKPDALAKCWVVLKGVVGVLPKGWCVFSGVREPLLTLLLCWLVQIGAECTRLCCWLVLLCNEVVLPISMQVDLPGLHINCCDVGCTKKAPGVCGINGSTCWLDVAAGALGGVMAVYDKFKISGEITLTFLDGIPLKTLPHSLVTTATLLCACPRLETLKGKSWELSLLLGW